MTASISLRPILLAALLASLAACATTQPAAKKTPAATTNKKAPPPPAATTPKKAPPAKPTLPPGVIATKVSGTPYELQLKPGNPAPHHGGELPMSMEQYGTRAGTSSAYTLVNTQTGKTVGQAESAITKGHISRGAITSDRKIEVASDGRILVQEDTTESFPTRRYILFAPKSSGTFQTYYLAPPVTPIPEYEIEKYNYTLPWIHFNDPGFSYYSKFDIPFNR
ncbi:hypothetical protein BH09VER1_BH09VER1_44140 [soil metagenome]